MPRRATITPDRTEIDQQAPLYNSGILANYIHFLETHHIEIDTDALLNCCGLTRFDLNDEGQFLSQEQVNTFHECLSKIIDDPDIAYRVGQYALYTKSTQPLMQYGFQFITPESMYKAVDRVYPKWSRGHLSETTIVGKGHAEITIRTRPGVQEQPFQCRNRWGAFEAIARIQTGRPAEVIHPECIHKGDAVCRYQIYWNAKPSALWKRVGAYAAVAGALIAAGALVLLPGGIGTILACVLTLAVMLVFLYANLLEKKEITNFLKEQGDAAGQLIDEIEVRHQNAQLIQEIGQAGANILQVNTFLETVLASMARYLDFARGMILLCDDALKHLHHVANFGFSDEHCQFLEKLTYDVDIHQSTDIFIRSLKTGKPVCFNDIKKQFPQLSSNSIRVIETLGMESLITVPLIHKKEPLGLLFVDTQDTRRKFTTSDVNLLAGIAAQLATGIVNARSYTRLQESEQRYRLLAENVMDVIWILDVATLRFKYISPSIENVLGYPAQEVLSMSLDQLLAPAAFETAVNTLSETLAKVSTGDVEPERQSITLELEEIHKNGAIVPIEVIARFLIDDSGSPVSVLGISRDLSRRKNAEREREKIETRLQQAKKMESLGTMAGSIAHNFNNLLMVVLGNLELAREDLPASLPATLNIKRAIGASQRAADLSSMMLTYVGQLKKESVPLDLSETVQRVLENMDESKMVNVDMDLDLADPMPLVAADEAQMRQLITGFVTNAIEALNDENGRVRISTGSMHCDRDFLLTTYLKEEMPEGRYAYVEVADTGCGMDAETLGKVFDPFFSTKFTGRGLGMAAVLGIIRSHNGAVRVRSTKGVGSVFTALFPIQGVSLRRKQLDESASIDFSEGQTVLLVDDEALVLEIGEQFLKRLGYSALTATDGQQAIDLYTDYADTIDCLLLDFTMPGMDGMTTMQAIKKINPDAKIIITSGYTRQQIEDRFSGIGMPDDFIQKPFEIQALQEKLRGVFSESD